MVKYYSEPLDRIFFALADSTRRGILVELRDGVKMAKELAMPFSISVPAISKHLKVLEGAKLIRRVKKGRNHYFTIEKNAFESVTDWTVYFEGFWNSNLGNLEAFLEEIEGD